MKPGKVYLVGAGPGDPGLLTLRGRECIAEADVILHDDLVDRRVLRFARKDAEIVAMGKHGDVSHRDRQQVEINRRMIAEARGGRFVVRLKGGDPFVFGRGGEEAEALAAAGIAFEVVPGVTSAAAVPAYAGIPLTHRGLNSSFTVVTGHEAPGAASHIDWEALAGMETVVFLMGLKRIEEILPRLVASGKSAATPAACVRSGTRPDQQVIVGTLGDLAEKVKAAGLAPPAVIVVGEVVRLRERLCWFESRPLLGRRIVVTRAEDQAVSFRDRLERLGAEIVEAPTISIAAPASFAAFDGALAGLARFDWVIFTSRNGVELFFARLLGNGGDVRDLGAARLAAIGPATEAALRERGLRVDVVPDDFRAEGLRDALGGQVAGKKVLLARAAGARDVLPRALAEAGAEVTDVATYQAAPTAQLPEAARKALRERRIDAVTFTSSSTVTSFMKLLGNERDLLGGVRIACIGPITAAAARDLGLEVAIEACEYTTDGLIAALVDYFSGGG